MGGVCEAKIPDLPLQVLFLVCGADSGVDDLLRFRLGVMPFNSKFGIDIFDMVESFPFWRESNMTDFVVVCPSNEGSSADIECLFELMCWLVDGLDLCLFWSRYCCLFDVG